jgi:hypothetical protein
VPAGIAAAAAALLIVILLRLAAAAARPVWRSCLPEVPPA